MCRRMTTESVEMEEGRRNWRKLEGVRRS